MSKPNKTVIITGGNTGLGYECAKVIASSQKWHVVIASRSLSRGNAAVQTLIHSTSNPNISTMELDLASTTSIRKLAAQYIQTDLPPLYAIVCNAGSQFVQNTQSTTDGVEATFGVNHLGHFLLVRLLLESLQEQGRIIVVSSDTHDPGAKTGMPAPRYTHPNIMSDPAQSDQFLSDLSPSARGQLRYTTSKLCNLYFTYELARQVQQSGRSVAVAAFNPGMMPGKGSALAREYRPLLRFMWNYVMPLMRFFNAGIRTTRQSGIDLASLVLHQPISELKGTYWDGPQKIPSSEESFSPERALELWDWSSERLGLHNTI